ncbi:MAG TPA: hypothetical protein VEW69_08670 [Alphaproteobacteria bacterium]|nr:hypothetical protein [Alphaproteobacteria bacterium]
MGNSVLIENIDAIVQRFEHGVAHLITNQGIFKGCDNADFDQRGAVNNLNEN